MEVLTRQGRKVDFVKYRIFLDIDERRILEVIRDINNKISIGIKIDPIPFDPEQRLILVTILSMQPEEDGIEWLYRTPKLSTKKKMTELDKTWIFLENRQLDIHRSVMERYKIGLPPLPELDQQELKQWESEKQYKRQVNRMREIYRGINLKSGDKVVLARFLKKAKRGYGQYLIYYFKENPKIIDAINNFMFQGTHQLIPEKRDLMKRLGEKIFDDVTTKFKKTNSMFSFIDNYLYDKYFHRYFLPVYLRQKEANYMRMFMQKLLQKRNRTEEQQAELNRFQEKIKQRFTKHAKMYDILENHFSIEASDDDIKTKIIDQFFKYGEGHFLKKRHVANYMTNLWNHYKDEHLTGFLKSQTEKEDEKHIKMNNGRFGGNAEEFGEFKQEIYKPFIEHVEEFIGREKFNRAIYTNQVISRKIDKIWRDVLPHLWTNVIIDEIKSGWNSEENTLYPMRIYTIGVIDIILKNIKAKIWNTNTNQIKSLLKEPPAVKIYREERTRFRKELMDNIHFPLYYITWFINDRLSDKEKFYQVFDKALGINPQIANRLFRLDESERKREYQKIISERQKVPTLDVLNLIKTYLWIFYKGIWKWAGKRTIIYGLLQSAKLIDWENLYITTKEAITRSCRRTTDEMHDVEVSRRCKSLLQTWRSTTEPKFNPNVQNEFFTRGKQAYEFQLQKWLAQRQKK